MKKSTTTTLLKIVVICLAKSSNADTPKGKFSINPTNRGARGLIMVLAFVMVNLMMVSTGYGAVSITVATGGDNIPADNASNGTPTYTSIGNIVITENANNDFPTSANSLVLNAPTGWSFKTSGVSVTVTGGTGGQNVTIVNTSITYLTNKITIPISVGHTNKKDILTIIGINIIANDGANVPGNGSITASGTLPAGLTTTTNLGTLSQTFGALNRIMVTLPGETFTDGTSLASSGKGGTASAQTAGSPFNLSLAATDQFYNIITNFASQTNITSTGTLTIGGDAVGAFSNGQATHGVRFSTGGTFTITASSAPISTESNSVTVNNPVPTISSISPTIICAGNNTITVNGTNFNSSSVINLNSTTISTTFVTSTKLTAIVSVPSAGDNSITVFNPTPGGGTSSAFTLKAVTSWLGITSDWNTAANWCSGTVPDASTDVVITAGVIQPIISSNANCRNIIMDPSTTLTITGTNTFSINGDWTNNGTFTPGSGTVVFNGGIQTVPSLTYNNLTISGSGIKTLAGDVTAANLNVIAGQLIIPATTKVDITGATNLASANALLIESNASSTGSLITGSVTGTGTAAVERYMSAGASHLVTSPLDGESIAGFLANPINANNLQSGTTDNDEAYRNMRDYKSDLNDWGEFFKTSDTDLGELYRGKGYSMRVRTSQTKEVVFTGALKAGDVSIPTVAGKWNSVGNPYTSAIAINSAGGATTRFLENNKTNLDEAYVSLYVWDPVEDPANYTVISNATTAYNVQQGQAFMVKMAPGVSAVNFTTAMQSHIPALPLKSTAGIWPTVELMATADGINSTTLIAFDEEMTAGLDPGYDAGYLSAGSSLEINTTLVEDYGIPFAIQALPKLYNETVIVPVNVNYTTGGSVSFSVTTKYLSSDYSVSLEDRQSNTFTQLTANNYSTDIAENANASGRFFLHISNATTGIDSQKNANGLKAWKNAINEMTIQCAVSNGAKATVLDVQGRLIVTRQLSEGNSHRISLPSLRPGIYLLKVTDNNKVQSAKVVIN